MLCDWIGGEPTKIRDSVLTDPARAWAALDHGDEVAAELMAATRRYATLPLMLDALELAVEARTLREYDLSNGFVVLLLTQLRMSQPGEIFDAGVPTLEAVAEAEANGKLHADAAALFRVLHRRVQPPHAISQAA